ncbi:hypothetical protein [uncultured Sphingobacterium sp.]|uniref:hypothetical protein n=1 Tax=uncultured Sphingobacterium sp. TaxID=182688 RepID=UPI0025F99BDE|nr:hypothetical protein [uncultured Sphingobacterium sp.]
MKILYLTINRLLFGISIGLLLLQSCSKSNNVPVVEQEGLAIVTVGVSVGDPEEEIVVLASNRKVTNSNLAEQVSEVAVSEHMTLGVTVTDQQHLSSDISELKNGYVAAKVNTGSLRAASQVITKSLDTNVKYRILVYDASGNYLQSTDYSYGANVPQLNLNAGQTYTFVVYSVNSTSVIPSVDGISSLSTAKLKDVNGDLMYFKKTMQLAYGNNNLAVILTHQFSQITTTVQMDNSMTGSIAALSNMVVSPTKSSATFSLNDGSFVYASTNSSAAIRFAAISSGSRSVTAFPTLVISPNTTTASLTIGSITLDGDTKNNIVVPNIKIIPGHKYNLILNFKACTQSVTSDVLNWNYERSTWTANGNSYTGINKDGTRYANNEVITNTFSAPQANYGFQFDITEFDNAFNMRINGQYIFGSSMNDQVQFQTNASLGTVRNIQFADGTEYAVSGIPEVYDMKGTSNAPLLRILISRYGEVTLLGSKSSGGPLVQLKLKNGLSFNTVNWSASGNNSVVISQKVDGRTVIIGQGNGRKLISCSGS